MSGKECPARVSRKECQARVSRKSVEKDCLAKSVKRESVNQECPARVSSKSVKRKCQSRLSSKECQERVSSKSVVSRVSSKSVKQECPQGWGGAGAALLDDSASHLRKQERFECYASIQSDCIRVRGFYQVLILKLQRFENMYMFQSLLSKTIFCFYV